MQMLDVADRLGDAKVNLKPIGPQTNAVAGLIVHCCELTEFWLGHVGLGRPSHRDRESEFTTTATLVELHARVHVTMAKTTADLNEIANGNAEADRTLRHVLPHGDTSAATLVRHL